MESFTFTTDAVNKGVFHATNDLIDATHTMPPATSAHIVQIFDELNGAELSELPYTYADVEMSGDPFEDCHGICEAEAASMFYTEHARPHIIERGCVLTEGTATYFSTLLAPMVEGTPDADMLAAASRRIMAVHLSLIHNVPMSELEKINDLIDHHQRIMEEFYDACAERPLPQVH